MSVTVIVITAVITIVGGLLVAVTALFLEHRTGWFAHYAYHKPRNDASATAVLDTFFGTWDRLAATSSVTLSLIAVILTIVPIQGIDKIIQLVLVRDTVLFAAILLLLITAVSRYIRSDFLGRHRRRQSAHLHEKIAHLNNQLRDAEALRQLGADRTNRLLKEAQEAVRNHKDLIFYNLVVDPPTPNRVVNFDEDTLRRFRQVCFHVTSGVRTSLIDLCFLRGMDIGDDISVTVKLVIPASHLLQLPEARQQLNNFQLAEANNEDRLVITAYRDPYTYTNKSERRANNAPYYSLRRNTAFNTIATSKDESPAFICNDLRGLAGTYINENARWRDYYNATHVVPIQYQNSAQGFRMLLGFLAVDSMNRQKYILFDNNESHYILWHAADLLSTFVLSLALYQESRNNKG